MMGKIETKFVGVTGVPCELLDRLRPFCMRDGRGDTDAAVVRYAVVQAVNFIEANESAERAAQILREGGRS